MDWEIQGLSAQCFGCQKALQNGDDFYCFLVIEPENQLKRNDFCRACFESSKSSWVNRTDLYSYWKGQVKLTPSPVHAPPLPYERFEILLRKYVGSQEERDKKFSYILALLLERKKILIHRESVLKDQETKRFLVYEHHESGETIILEDPHLSLNQVDEVQKELKSVMDQEFHIAPFEK